MSDETGAKPSRQNAKREVSFGLMSGRLSDPAGAVQQPQVVAHVVVLEVDVLQVTPPLRAERRATVQNPVPGAEQNLPALQPQ